MSLSAPLPHFVPAPPGRGALSSGHVKNEDNGMLKKNSDILCPIIKYIYMQANWYEISEYLGEQLFAVGSLVSFWGRWYWLITDAHQGGDARISHNISGPFTVSLTSLLDP